MTVTALPENVSEVFSVRTLVVAIYGLSFEAKFDRVWMNYTFEL